MDNIVPIAPNQGVVNVEPVADLWADFWTLYPRHEAKKDALKAWSKLSAAEQAAAIVAAADWRQVWRAQGRELHVIPLPATWLRGERWEDEIPAGMLSGRPGAHALAQLPPTHQKATEIPERVKAVLAKLRGGR